jgi:predicted  nucleic acid-binding Zn ribbon protein
VSQSVKIPDPVYKTAKKEAAQQDKSISSVIDSWRFKAQTLDRENGGSTPTLTNDELKMNMADFKAHYE